MAATITTMTALEAFQATAEADVYIQTDDGRWPFIASGMRHGGGVALKVEHGNYEDQHLDLKSDERVYVKVYR